MNKPSWEYTDEEWNEKLREEFSAVIAFHERRLQELARYEEVLDKNLVPDNKARRLTKEELSYRKLLMQPISYQVLVRIWIGSPYPSHVEGEESAGWSAQTVSSLAREVSTSHKALKRTANYIDRVADAAVYYGLVVRNRVAEKNKVLLLGAPNLDSIMRQVAAPFLKSRRPGDSND